MNPRQLFFTGVALLLQIPLVTQAAGLVPCGGRGEPVCQTCYALSLVTNIAAWLTGILSIAAAIMFVIAGFRIVTAQGNPSTIKDAKNMIVNVAIGFVIVLSAWLGIDFLMKSLLSDESAEVGPWNTIACVDQPNTRVESGEVRIVFPTPGQSRGTAFNSGQDLDPTILIGIANLSAAEADALIAERGAAAGLDATQIRNMQALMRVESGGCRNLVSPVGALGCMQIMPGTARQYDPSLQGLSDAEVRERLLQSDYNISLGTQIYADLYEINDGDERRVYAAYNGGQGALAPSSDCPGLMRYQCVWDSPGCYGTDRTDCTPNTGYIETRNYVEKVSAVANQL